MVAHIDAAARANLEFPLARHNLCVSTRDCDSSVEASLVVHVGNNTAEAIGSAHGAVVGSLRAWVAVVGPAERPGGELGKGSQQGVFLLNAVPGLFVLDLLGVEDLLGEVPEVGVVGNQFGELAVSPHVALSKHNYVIALSEGVTEVRNWLEDDF